MYHDSGPFLRESALPSGFAGRRMERRMEPGTVARGVWRSPGGAVLRLLPERLAALTAEVRAAVHPAHPAAADPRAAVLHHVAGLARTARPAGTVTDRATGRTLHVFRAPGHAGEMEIVTAPPRGALFDIVEVRPAGMQGEMEVYQWGAQGYQDAQGRRVRGAHATLNWERILLANARNDDHQNCVYILTRRSPAFNFEIPRYVGEAEHLGNRWAARLDVLRVFEVDLADCFLWVGTVTTANANQVRFAPGGNQASWPKLIRQDIEHVLIRELNSQLPAGSLGTRMAGQHVSADNISRELVNLGAFPNVGAISVVAQQVIADFAQNAHPAPDRYDPWENLLHELRARVGDEMDPRFHIPLLTNQRSIAPGVSEPNQQSQYDGVNIINTPALHLPWFLRPNITLNRGTAFELPDDFNALVRPT